MNVQKADSLKGNSFNLYNSLVTFLFLFHLAPSENKLNCLKKKMYFKW